MARPHKTPLTYFPFATGFPNDDKILILVGEFGAKGEAVVVRLWCALYGTYGYYLPYDDTTTPPTIARVEDRRYGVSSTLVVAIVNRAIQVGLFHEALYKQYGILTSQPIQERYFHAVSRRRGVTAIRQYLLVSPPVGVVIVDINPINVDNNELNKMKDNILTNARILSYTERENNNLKNLPKERKKKKESNTQQSLVEIFFFRNFSRPAAEAQRFTNHYNARGWRDSSGAEIHDIHSLARSWEQRGTSRKPHQQEALSAFHSFYSNTLRDELTADKRDELLSLITALVREGNTLIIHCPRIAANFIEQQLAAHVDTARRQLQPFTQIKYNIL